MVGAFIGIKMSNPANKNGCHIEFSSQKTQEVDFTYIALLRNKLSKLGIVKL